MRRHRSVDRFGRMAVGQRIRFDWNCVLPPTTDPKEFKKAFYRWEVELLTLSAEGTILQIRLGEFHCFVTMRFDDGREVTRTLDSYGMEPGGWDRLHVLQEAPSQRSLIRETA